MPAARRLKRIAGRGSNTKKEGVTGTLVHVQERRSRRLGLDRENPRAVVPDPGVSPLVNMRCHARLDSAKKAWSGGKDSSHFGRRADRVPAGAGDAFTYGLRLLGAGPFSRLVSPTGAAK